jgi:anaphase-promoting complex subunit 1
MLKTFALPVQVANVWHTKFGIMLERVIETVPQKVSSNSVSDVHSSVGHVPKLPIVFALLHPLDEVSPVLSKHGRYNA